MYVEGNGSNPITSLLGYNVYALVSVESWGILSNAYLPCRNSPPSAGAIPIELGNLSKLEVLDLRYNKLSGEVMLLVPIIQNC